MILLALLLACPPKSVETAETGEVVSYEGIALRGEGWLRGDLHVHSDAFDDLATDIRLGEYLEDPTFLAFHPEYEGNHLDFLAITNHNDASSQEDPAFTSDRLVLLPAEEFSVGAHANTFGVAETLVADPEGDGLTLADVEARVEEVHAQGGIFSVNHPFLADIPFPWDLRTMDAFEVWNAGWGLGGAESTEETLAGWVASYGEPGLPYQRAIQTRGSLDAGQGLTWYQALLSRGVHVAVVGGSDRHAVLLPGFPTTWVQSDPLGDAVDVAGIFQGIRDRHTFVSRTPVSAQVLLTVETAAGTFVQGDAIPVSTAGGEVTVTVRVGRAAGGILRVLGGPAVATDADLAGAPLGTVLHEAEVDSDDFTASFAVSAEAGGWLFPYVLEPLVRPDATDEQAARVEDMATQVLATGSEDYVGLARLAADVMDPEVLGDASTCDPEDWQPDLLQCALADQDGIASFFVPDLYDRALNATATDGAIDGLAMGAVASAVLFTAE